MPKAPQIEQQVRAAGVPGVRLGSVATPESYGAGVGETTRRIGLALYEQELQAQDQAVLLEADTKLNTAQLEVQDAMRKLRGKEAAQVPDLAQREMQQRIQEIGQGIPARQRGRFDRIAQMKSEALDRQALDYAHTENEHFLDQTFTANMQSSLDIVRANPNPIGAALEKDIRAMKVDGEARRKGIFGTDAHTRAVRESSSEVDATVIEALVARGDDLSAKAYYDGLKLKERAQAGDPLLTAKHREQVERVLDEGSTRGEAQRLVRGLLRDGKTEAEILKHIDDKVDNPKIVDLAHQLVGRHFREQAAIQKEAGDTAYTNLLNKVEEQPGTHPRMLADPQVWASLSINERHAIEERSKSLVKYEKPDRANDDALWLDFLALKPEDVAKLSRRDFDQKYWSHFDNHTRQRAETQWNTYKDALSRKDEKQVDPKVTASLTFKDQVNNAWSLSGLIDPSKERSKWSKDEMMQFVRFEDQAAQALQHYELTKLDGKRHATPDEVREVIKKVRDQAVQKVFTPGRFFGSNEKAAIGLEEDEKKQAFVPIDKIPKDSLDDLTRYIESLGKKATPDKLRRAYAKKLLNDREGFNAVVNE